MKIEISKDTPLAPGDKLEIHVQRRGFGIIKNFLGMIIEKDLRADPRFEVTSWDITEDKAVYYITVKEQSPQVQRASIITAGVIIAAIIGISTIFLSVTVYKVTDKAAEVLETPTGKVLATGVSGLGIAAAVLTIASILGNKK